MWKSVKRVFIRSRETDILSYLSRSNLKSNLLCQVCPFTNRRMSSTVTIATVQGALRGKQECSKSGFKYYSFKGIPYAKPPVGSLRFKAPLAHGSWSGVRDAFEDGQACPQIDEIFRLYKGDEDCLFLNVFTPKDPTKREPLKPVMVWIHGGGFNRGSGNTEVYGPEFLVAEDVVLVTINYRVGPFGFLCLDTEDVPGNAGLKDQVMALKWVQQNITQFGGDPRNITIFGESAGGASVHYHLLSPMSKGLFHQAIAQSGSSLNPWAFSWAIKRRTFSLGKVLGCTTDSTDELLKFLQNAPAKDIVDAALECLTVQERKQMVLFPFVPCVEKIKGHNDVFLSTPPHSLIEAGKFQHVPFLIGYNSEEGLIALNGLKPEKLAKTDKDPQTFIPADLPVEIDSSLAKNIAMQIKQLYFGKQAICQKTLQQYAKVISHMWFTYGIYKTIKMQAALSKAPLYSYNFSFDGNLGMFKRMLGLQEYQGVCHADDIGYLFDISLASFDVDADSPESKTRARMIKLWTNFAKTGNPTPEKTELLDVIWKPVEKDKLHQLNIDKELTMKELSGNEYTSFWDSVYNGTFINKGKL